jgi:MFS family permease
MEKKEILNKKLKNKPEPPKIYFEDNLINETKKISVKEAGAYSVMDGFGLKYITPYALAVGASNTQIGIISSLPSLLGNLSQLLTLKVMKFWTRKKIVFFAVLLQSLMWLALLAVGSMYFIFGIKSLSSNLVIAVYTLLILFGAFGGPAWQSWMKDLIKKGIGIYFGKRSRIATTISLCCMIIAGFILDYFKKTNIFIGFVILFLAAGIGRFISARLMLKQYEPPIKIDDKYFFSLKDFIKRMHKNNFGRFVIYFSLVSLTVNISGPFLAVYMLKNLSFSYTYFMTVTLASVITTLLFVSPWGKFADKYGNLKTMKITGALTPLMPLLWLSSIIFTNPNTVFIYLILVECFSGAIWAGFNIAAGNFIYDAVSRQRVAICATYYNILAGLGVLIGSLFGGILSSKYETLLGMESLLFIFLLGGTLRFIVYFAMNSKIQEVRKVKHFSVKEHLISIKDKFRIGKSEKRYFEFNESSA